MLQEFFISISFSYINSAPAKGSPHTTSYGRVDLVLETCSQSLWLWLLIILYIKKIEIGQMWI
jgi:hypothetical protein